MLFDYNVFNLISEHFNTIGIVLLCYGGYVGLMKITYAGKHVSEEDIEYYREQDIMKRVFPILSPGIKKRFTNFKMSCQRFDVLFFLRITIGTIFFFGRCNAFRGYHDGPYFRSFIIVGAMAWFFFILWFVAMGIEILLRKCSTQSINAVFFLQWANYMQRIISTGICEEIAVICGQVAFGLSLYGRVKAGQCLEGTTWLDSARCNPAANSHSIPMDHVMYMIVFPIVTPLTVRNIRFESGVLMWFIVVGFVILSMDHVNAGTFILPPPPDRIQIQLLSNPSPLFLILGPDGWMIVVIMVVSLTFVYENERFLKHSFLRSFYTQCHAESPHFSYVNLFLSSFSHTYIIPLTYQFVFFIHFVHRFWS